MKVLKIITLESIDGIGVSTQIRFLRQQLTELDYKVQTFKYNGLQESIQQSKKIQEFLDKTTNGIILNDGTFAKSIAHDMINGYSKDKLEEKYKDILYHYECLNYRYELLNIVLLPENADMGQKRSIKHAKILEKEYYVLEDLQHQKDMLSLLGQINSHVITRSIRFTTLDIYESDKILDINNKIWELLKLYDIKKPS